MPQQGALGQRKVGTGGVEILIHQEILLLPAKISDHLVHLRIEITTHLNSRLAQRLDGTDQRSLIVQCLTCIGNKHRRNTERVVHDKGGRRGIPSGVATGLEGVTQATVGEAGGIRLLLHQQLTAELLDHATIPIMLHKGIMLLSRAIGQRLEPVRIVGHSLFQSPHAHTRRHVIRDLAVDRYAVINRIGEGLIGLFREILLHRLPIEDVLSIIL